MRKTIIVGNILASFLLLMIPNVNSIENQNHKNIMTSEIEAMDYHSFIKMVKQMPKDERRALYKGVIQGSYNDPPRCDDLENLAALGVMLLIFGIGVFILMYAIFFAAILGCDWVQPPTDNSCSTCAFEEFIIWLQSNSQMNNFDLFRNRGGI